MNARLDFFDVKMASDVAAQVLDQQRPSKSGYGVLRQAAVHTLRLLWRNADQSERVTIAARIHVWLETPYEQRQACRARILKRGEVAP